MPSGRVSIEVTVKAPVWARVEAPAVQRLIVEHRLNPKQVRTLRQFAANSAGVDQPLKIAFSTARAFVSRDLGDVRTHGGDLPGKMSRHHPEVYFRLNEDGMKLAVRLGTRDATPEGGQ